MKENLAGIQFVKHNRIYYKRHVKRGEAVRMLSEFFDGIEGAIKGMKGYAIMDGIEDQENESVILTFWENKEAMDSFYKPDNKLLTSLVERLQQFFEHEPKRESYSMTELRI